MSDDRIIDLSAYLEAREGESGGADHPLALRGTDGERRRFVLPLWRVAYVAGAGWAGLVVEERPGVLQAVVVVDLRRDPARAAPDAGLPTLTPGDRPPAVRSTPSGELVLPLGDGPRGRRWALVLAERNEAGELEREAREDLLYLAGECAGLVHLTEG